LECLFVPETSVLYNNKKKIFARFGVSFCPRNKSSLKKKKKKKLSKKKEFSKKKKKAFPGKGGFFFPGRKSACLREGIWEKLKLNIREFCAK